jgi:CRP-like cAMP-binding protein
MHNKFINYFSSISPLSTAESNAIREHMILKTFKKGDYLLKEGQFSVDTYFILEGCIREYILTDGEEKTTLVSVHLVRCLFFRVREQGM